MLPSITAPGLAVRDDVPLEIAALRQHYSLTPVVAQLLWNRGWRDDAGLAGFLDPQLSRLHSPWMLRDMDRAVARIRAAIAAREPLVIFGDYDVDGVAAVVVLREALRRLGAQAVCFIPDRFASGYGPSLEAFRQFARDGVRLIITVDTGIRALDEVALARDLGLDVIVTDHHLPGPELPAAVAVINPRRSGCEYPDKDLSGAGLAFKLAQALFEDAGLIAAGAWPGWLAAFIKIVALGVIADHVPLRGENRILAHHGLAGLAQPVNPGLRALLAQALPQASRVRSGDVAFQLVPRLNAAGRLASAELALELFSSPAPQAQAIALRLDGLNRERRCLEAEILAAIEARWRSEGEWDCRIAASPVALLWGEGWHRGVLGIVAARLLQQLQKPVLVAGCHDGVAHGSGRAPQGFHLLETMEACAGFFTRFGGHAQAVGFSLPAERLPELAAHLASLPPCAVTSPGAGVSEYDLELPLAAITPALLADLDRLQPFGAGNPEPWFRARARLAQPVRVLKERHLKLVLAPDWEALAWHAVRGQRVEFPPLDLPVAALQLGCEVELIYRLEPNASSPRGAQLVLRSLQL